MPVSLEQKLFIPMEHHHNHEEVPQHLDYSYNSGSESEESSGGKESKRAATIKSAPPGTIQWLKDCYELCDNNSVPRCSVYNHYASYCSSTGVNPINAASFGKVIRSVFPNLKTRRLGTRGNSKYHYLGLKLKNESIKTFEQANLSDATYNKPYQEPSPPMKNHKKSKKVEEAPQTVPHQSGTSAPQLGEFVIPVDAWSQVHDLPLEDARVFFDNYRNHCQQLLELCFHHQFAEVEKVFKSFWTQFAPRYMGLMNFGEIIDFIIDKDHLTYKSIAGALLPNVLQALPVSMSQTIRQFAEHLEQSLAGALINAPPNLAVVKLIVARKFAQSLNKQAALNHLTQAARAVLQNQTQIQAMIVDWSKLDFDFIKEQASWVCQCPDEFVLAVMEGFKKHLTERASLETWAGWLQEIVFKILGKIHDSQSLLFMSQQMLLKWSFYSTLVMRDLTIRNAQSFGSFHLLRTLFDEYIFYIIESKFAFVPPPPFYDQTTPMNHIVSNNSSSINNNSNHYPQAPQPEPASHPSNPPDSLGSPRPSMSLATEYSGFTHASFDLGRPSISLESLLSNPGTLSFLRNRSDSLFGRSSFVFSGATPQTPTQSSSHPANNNNNQSQDSQQASSTEGTDPSYFAHLAARFRSDDFMRSRNSLPRASISNLLSTPIDPAPSGSTTPTSEILKQFGYFNGLMNGPTFSTSGSFPFEPRNSQYDWNSLVNSRPSIHPSDASNDQKRSQEATGQSNQNSSS